MTDKIHAPWTPEQVAALNRFQQYGGMHPFTCGRDHHGTNVVLMARPDGWHCSDPACGYRQDWAHAFMANPDAWPKSPFRKRHGTTPTQTDGPEPPPPLSEAEQLRDTASALQTIVNRVREAVGTDQAVATESTNTLLNSRMVASAAVYNSVLVRALNAEDRLARVREYAATSDDDGIHTRQNILRIVGEWTEPEPAPTAATQTTGRQTRYRTCRECGAIVHYLNMVIHMREEHPQLDDDATPTATDAAAPIAVHSCGQEPHTRDCVTTILPATQPEPNTVDGWTREDDGIWTLPIEGGTILMSRQTTPEERARFAEQWKRGHATASLTDAIKDTDG